MLNYHESITVRTNWLFISPKHTVCTTIITTICHYYICELHFLECNWLYRLQGWKRNEEFLPLKEFLSVKYTLSLYLICMHMCMIIWIIYINNKHDSLLLTCTHTHSRCVELKKCVIFDPSRVYSIIQS